MLDWEGIARARAFAREWHAGTWSVDRLPARLGATVVTDDGDPILLGATDVDDGARLIYVHQRLAGPAYVGVLSHECAHPFAYTSGIQLCAGPSAFAPGELSANVIASVLAVPLAEVRDVHLDDGSASAVAEALCVPRPMVRVRRTLATVLGELPGRRDHALHSLTSACIGLAAYFWRESSRLAASDPTAPYYRPLRP